MADGRKPFFPNDKPRSWVIGISAGLLGMAFGGLGFLGYFLNVKAISIISVIFFGICWAVAFAMILLFNIKFFTGRYRKMEPSSWKDRPW